MDFLRDIKAATTALTLGRSPSLPAEVVISRNTGINRFGLFGFGALELFPSDNTKLFDLGFVQNHYVHAIVDWTAQRFAQAPPVVYEIKSQKHFGRYKSLTPYQKANEYVLRQKSIEEVSDPSDSLVKVLKRPNPSQTWAEFAYAAKVYYDFGNALIYGAGPDKGINKGQFKELYLLPTALYAGEGPSISGYAYYVDSTGVNERIDGANVLHLRRFNPDPFQKGGTLWGMSRLTPARRLLTKSVNAQEAEAEAMQNRGGRTLVFPKGSQYSDETTSSVKDATEALRRKLKQAGTNGVAGFNVEIGAIEVGMSPVDLNIIESNVCTKEEFCALWHVDANSIFSSTKSGSLGGNKQEEANKASLRSGVLPDQSLFYQKLNDWLLPAYNEANKYQRYIEANTDVYPELQADKKDLMDWMEKMGSSFNERREAAGWERSDVPGMDIPIAPPGSTPITDFAAPDTAPTDPNNTGY